MNRRRSYHHDRRSSGGLLPKVLAGLLVLAGLVVAARGAFRAGGEPEIVIQPKTGLSVLIPHELGEP